ncbi:uncharacterized protein LOC133524054 [Cydia pomonella]|uniref:uncharacterized protein LOC133524054 n=1 Tax=Cydia pomonella TaxID=82600 RepID=UPI002ADE3569|nr:uncharacterized protein LOC133524054 [Cydia pomonella]
MPSDDVSDLRDVVDAINKLCDTMKTSSYDEETFESCSQSGSVDLVDALITEETIPEETVVEEVESDPDWYVACQVETADPSEVIFKKVEHYNTETWRQSVSRLEVVSPEDVVVSTAATYIAETWRYPQAEVQITEHDRWSETSRLEKLELEQKTHDNSERSTRDTASQQEVLQKAKAETQDRWSDPSSRSEIVSPEFVQRAKVETQDRWSDPSLRSEIVSPELVQRAKVETQDRWSDPSSRSEIVSPEIVQKHEGSVERWSDSSVSLPGQIEEETVTSDERQAHESEMYYTASSEVSLLSDLEGADKVQEEPVEKEDDRKECVIAGHVAAMRERFENMTRANTPCTDLARSASPALDVFTNVTPSPDRLG